jgi:hypothetical protein
MIYTSNMPSTNPKYVIFNFTQKNTKYVQYTCEQYAFKSCQIYLFCAAHNIMYFKLNFLMLVVYNITFKNIFFQKTENLKYKNKIKRASVSSCPKCIFWVVCTLGPWWYMDGCVRLIW